MESVSFKIGLRFAALIVFASFSNGSIDQCNTASTYPTAISCNPSSNSASSLPIILCPRNDEIPLPSITPHRCNSTGRNSLGVVNCYYDGGKALVDGDLNTPVIISSRERSWDIWLGQQFSVYAVYVLFLKRVPGDAKVRVQTRQQVDGTINERRYDDTDCHLNRISDSRLRFVFYCLPNNTINDNQMLSGRITQNVEVTVNPGRQTVELVEIQVYENQGHECGKPSHPWKTVYNPNKSRYSVGEQVEYSCKDSSFVMFGSNTRYCGADGRWAGYAPLCRQTVLLKNDSFQMDSIDPVLLDQNTTTCSPNKLLEKNKSNNQSVVDYAIPLKTPNIIIGKIHISILVNPGVTPNGCQIEIPSHPEIIFVLDDQSGKVQNGTSRTLIFVPRMHETNENGSWCQSNENPGKLIQLFAKSNVIPNINLKCSVPTSLCEISVHKVQDTDAKNRCGDPEKPLNSNFTIKNESGLRKAVYTCDPMFRLFKSSVSRSTSECTDGQWNRPPICERIYCRNYPPERDDRGAGLIWKLSPYSSDLGAIARYVRSDGSEPSPPVLRTCNNDGQWEVTISPENDQTATIAASVSVVLLIVIVIIVFIFRRRRFRNSARASAQNYFSDSSGIHFRNELPAGGPPLLPPNRHDSTIYEEIENVYDYDEIGNMKGEGFYDDASKNQVGPSHPNEYSSKQLLDTSGSLFPRPPPVIPK